VANHGPGKGPEAFEVIAEDWETLVALQYLYQAAESHGSKNLPRGGSGAVARLDDFDAGDALGPWQTSIHAERPPQQDYEEHANQPAGQ